MIEVKNLHLKFPGFQLDDISFQVNENECLTFLGPSGSGKSCILRSIVGIYKPTGGQILINNRDVTKLPPEDRHIGYAFQESALIPSLGVFDNIAFGLKIRRIPKAIIEKKVREIAGIFHIDHLLDRSIAKLSGGEAQRISLARTIVIEPEILLLDEPFSKLDKLIQDLLIIELKKIIKQKRLCVVHVTHDQTEAYNLADKIAVIKKGRLVQLDSPQRVFNNPNSQFTAEFVKIGNIFKGKIDKSKKQISYNEKLQIKYGDFDANGNSNVQFCIRPENVNIYKNKPVQVAENIYMGIVDEVVRQISTFSIFIQADDLKINTVQLASDAIENDFKVGDKVYFELPKQKIHIFSEN
jgi:molybdate/tungstate transport system ATP-binding protein